MAKKKEEKQEKQKTGENGSAGNGASKEILTSRQEVADALKISPYQLWQRMTKYPPAELGIPMKVSGRFHVYLDDVHAWNQYVQRQELRHPDARRMRPDEAPELSKIRGRKK